MRIYSKNLIVPETLKTNEINAMAMTGGYLDMPELARVETYFSGDKVYLKYNRQMKTPKEYVCPGWDIFIPTLKEKILKKLIDKVRVTRNIQCFSNENPIIISNQISWTEAELEALALIFLAHIKEQCRDNNQQVIEIFTKVAEQEFGAT